jgi:DNA-binding beta-propeller fold protein YncE
VIAVWADTERLTRLDLETGKAIGRLDRPSGGVQGIAVSPDGGSVLVTGEDKVARVFSTASGKQVQSFEPVGGRFMPITAAFGPDGQRVYSTGISDGVGRFTIGGKSPEAVYTLGTEPAGTSSWRKAVTRPATATCVAVACDEVTIAVGGSVGQGWVFAAGTGKLLQDFRLPSPVRAVAFSASGRVLAVALDDGSLRLIPLKG